MYFCGYLHTDSKVHVERQKTHTGGLLLPDFKTQCEGVLITTVRYWQKRQIDQWNRILSPETDLLMKVNTPKLELNLRKPKRYKTKSIQPMFCALRAQISFSVSFSGVKSQALQGWGKG